MNQFFAEGRVQGNRGVSIPHSAAWRSPASRSRKPAPLGAIKSGTNLNTVARRDDAQITQLRMVTRAQGSTVGRSSGFKSRSRWELGQDQPVFYRATLGVLGIAIGGCLTPRRISDRPLLVVSESRGANFMGGS